MTLSGQVNSLFAGLCRAIDQIIDAWRCQSAVMKTNQLTSDSFIRSLAALMRLLGTFLVTTIYCLLIHGKMLLTTSDKSDV